MARLYDTVIDDDVRGALDESGFYTEGFEGETLGSYKDWYQGAFGMDPFQTATSLSGGRLPTDVDDPAAFIRRNPMNFDPNQGFTGNPADLSNIQLAQVQQLEERRGAFQEQQSRQQGKAMINWLMGLSTKISGADFNKIAPIGMARAQADLSDQASVPDFSGILGVRNADQMAAERRQAAEFDFTRDLLPSLISLGGIFGDRRDRG